MDDPHPDERLLSHSGRRGMTLVEILVALTIISLMVLLSFPLFVDRYNDARADAVIKEMQTYQEAIQRFRDDVGRYPGKLTYLSILEDSTGVVDACGTAISSVNQGRYRGPYVARHLSPVKPYPPNQNTRFVIATDDSVDALLTRTTIATAGGGTQQVLQIRIIGPSASATQLIDEKADGVVDNAAGMIRYGSVQPAQNVLFWTFPIPNGAC